MFIVELLRPETKKEMVRLSLLKLMSSLLTTISGLAMQVVEWPMVWRLFWALSATPAQRAKDTMACKGL